jgi:hypothetical protein
MDLARRFEGKKFMWDGQSYPGEAQAAEAGSRYQTDGFQTQMVTEDGNTYVFSRKEIKEISIEGKN